jgi:hypothetical protein
MKTTNSIDKKALFAQAWAIVKSQGVKIGEALKMVWNEVKEPVTSIIEERRLATALYIKTSYAFRDEFAQTLFNAAKVGVWFATYDVVARYLAWSNKGGMTCKQADAVAGSIFKAIQQGKLSRAAVIELRNFINSAYLQNA